MSEKYSFPVTVHLEVDQPLTGRELQTVMDKMVEEMDYAVQTFTVIGDGVQEKIQPTLIHLRITSSK